MRHTLECAFATLVALTLYAVACAAYPKPNASAARFDVDDAITMALLSSIAYCIDDIDSWSCKYCLDDRVKNYKPLHQLVNDSIDTHGYVALNDVDQQIIISFRGTEDLRNWITDLNAFSKADMVLPFCEGQTKVFLHSGFFNAYMSVRDQMLQILSELDIIKPNYQVYVIGHSLGAAVATIAALDLTCGAQPYHGKPVVYNYGSPRVGDASFATLAAQNVPMYRSTHWQDIVPHVPPENIFGFQHVPTEYFSQEVWDGNNVKECDHSGEDPSCADQFSYWSGSIDDHLLYYNITVSSSAC